MIKILYVLWVLALSTLWYLYLHRKTKIRKRYVYIDNLLVVLLTLSISWFLFSYVPISFKLTCFVLGVPLFLGFSFVLTMVRFWRTPNRKMNVQPNEIVSPADGNIIYIKKVAAGDVPVSIKKGVSAKLSEITQSDLLKQESWLIGINMTPFDVHKNCAPVSGEVVLNKHIKGSFLSLKDPNAIVRNERNTLIIKTKEDDYFGIVQTASKLVRRIDTYVEEGQGIKQGDWFGMIRFGSQVDLILPSNYIPNVILGQQVFAKTTIIAKK